jgi:biopolymer transport protein ExbD
MEICAMTMNDAAVRRLTSEINMTPMIDVLLVLLIIFMVIVPATSRGEVALAPKPAHQVTPSQPDAVVLEVLKGDGGGATFKINQQIVSKADLPVRLGTIYANRAQRVLFIKGDDQLSFRQIAEVIDISHSAGVDHVGLMTPKTAVGL